MMYTRTIQPVPADRSAVNGVLPLRDIFACAMSASKALRSVNASNNNSVFVNSVCPAFAGYTEFCVSERYKNISLLSGKKNQHINSPNNSN